MSSVQIPVNPADKVPDHLNTTKYSDPLDGVMIETIPVPLAFVVIFGLVQGFFAEL